MQISPELKELFTFSTSERNGLIVLLIITFSVSSIGMYLNYSKGNGVEIKDTEQIDKEIALFRASLKKTEKNTTYYNRLDQFIIKRYDTISLFKFNPNTATPEEWKKLGLSRKQIKNIKNYKAKGGKFYEKNDLQKIYGIRNRQYLILKPYIDLPEKQKKATYTKSYNTDEDYTDYNIQNSIISPDTLFTFNPNNASQEEFEQLGFSYKQSKAIINYRKKGGKFKVKSDIKKIYTVTDNQYETWEPYIDLPDELSKPKKAETILVNINALSEAEFKKLKDKFWQYNARKIVKYRELLGGYVKPEQLLEVYGVKKQYYEKIKNQIAPISNTPRQINLNTATPKQLYKHPYIGKYEAQAILKYRKKHKNFKNINELIKNNLISKIHYNKLKPYIHL